MMRNITRKVLSAIRRARIPAPVALFAAVVGTMTLASCGALIVATPPQITGTSVLVFDVPRVPGREGSVLYSVFCFLGVWGASVLVKKEG